MLDHSTKTTLVNQETETLIAQNTSVGSWQLLPYTSPVLPIDAALLRTGKVLFIAGSGNNPANVNNSSSGSAVLDLNTGTFSRPVIPNDDAGLPIDLFCPGHSFLPDGRLMVAGGTEQYDPFQGLAAALTFDPIAETWTRVASMNSGRWYPTVLTLGDGRILAVSGRDENGQIDTYPEIYSESTGWNFFTQPTSRIPMYAHLFLLSSGKIFYSGAQMSSNYGVSPRLLTLPTSFTEKIVETPVPGLVSPDSRNQAASVLLPPAQDQKVLIIGGGGSGIGINSVNIVDLKAATPTYTAAAPLNYARMHHSAVLLPDRTVFVCNGSARSEDGAQATRTAEIYNPVTNTWKLAATANVVNRVYHSVALLLPDGRVLTAGGNPKRTSQEMRLEIYSPAYMSKPRPVIVNAPQKVAYGQTFQIETPQGLNIFRVHLIKPMATTHCMDTEQRMVEVRINSRASTSLSVTLLPNASWTLASQRNLAPPGWYMLSILDNSRVPSVAKWIQVVPPA